MCLVFYAQTRPWDARNREGKVNILIGMSTIPHTYLTPKPWELQPKSDTFLSGENSQAVKASMYCQLQPHFHFLAVSYLIFFIRCYHSPFYFPFVCSVVAQCFDPIPLFIRIGISCINYGPLIVPVIRNRSWPSTDSPGKFPFQVDELGMCPFTVKVDGGVTIFKSTGVYAALWHKAATAASCISPRSNPFHRFNKVFLTLKNT